MKINSPEYFNALKDYNFTIKNGYYFKTGDIFSKFVDDFYLLRNKYTKGDPMNLTCKLIMNSLYGRFGMAPILTKQEFVSKEKFKELTLSNEIVDFLDLDEYGLFVGYIDNKLSNKLHKMSVCIASAVTAYSRIYMSKFKNSNDYNLYYSDTDSLFIDKNLPESLIGDKIGQFKLEYSFKEVVFLGPKIYGGIT
uniref:DNA polymerase n=1 Tax=Poriella subacida TaxID=2872513 RepID=UPI003001B4EC|nr:DNA polymerase [Poriella subacida]